MPSAATAITIPPGTSGGAANRRRDSPSSAPEKPDQQQRVGQRRQLRGATPAIGVARGRLALGEQRGAPGQGQAERVAQVVQGVRQQGQGLDVEAVAGLDRRVGQVDRHRDRERARSAWVRMAMAMRVAMAVAVFMAGHARFPQPPPCTSVPSGSPRRIRISAPGCIMS